MNFHHNCWHAAAYLSEIGRSPIARTIANVSIVMFRRMDGAAVAMSNLCPHRFAPLDRGKLVGDTLTCKYHGLAFGADGRCVRSPHTDRITPKMHLASYPVAERHGFVWIWLGMGEDADPDAVPDMSVFKDVPGKRTLHNYLRTNFRYDILIDNLMDFSHVDYLHEGSFSSGAAEKYELVVKEDKDDVIVVQTAYRAPPPPPAAAVYTGGLVDVRSIMHWHPGQVVTFTSRVAPAGTNFEVSDELQFFHIATPMDGDHTHYFFGLVRVGPDDASVDEAMRTMHRLGIETEDGSMLDAVHANMAGRDLLELKPLILPVDSGGLRVRKVMKRLYEREVAKENLHGAADV